MHSSLIRDIPTASTRSRLVYIDSRDRSRILYPHTNDYSVALPDPLFGVQKVELLSAEIPKSEYFLASSNNDTLEVVFDPSLHTSASPTGTTGWPVLLRVGSSSFLLFRVDVSGNAHGVLYHPIGTDPASVFTSTFNASQTSHLSAALLSSSSADMLCVACYSEPDTDYRASCRIVIVGSASPSQVLLGSEFGFDSDAPVRAKHVASLGDGRRFLVCYTASATVSGTTTSSVRAIVGSTGVDPGDTALRSTNAVAYSAASEVVVAHVLRELPGDRVLVVYKTAANSLRSIVVSVSTGFAVKPHFPATTIVDASAYLGDFDADVHGDRVLVSWTTSASRIVVAAARIVASTVLVVYDGAMVSLPYVVDDAVRVRFLSDALTTHRLDAHIVAGEIVLRHALTGADFPGFSCVQGERYRFIVRPATSEFNGDAPVFTLFTSSSASAAYLEGVSGSLFVVTSDTPRTLWYGSTTSSSKTSAAAPIPSASRGTIAVLPSTSSTSSSTLDFGVLYVGAHDPGNIAYAWGTQSGHGDHIRSTRVAMSHSLGGSGLAGFTALPAASACHVAALDAHMDLWLATSDGPSSWLRVPTLGTPPAPRLGATLWFDESRGELFAFGGRLLQDGLGSADAPPDQKYASTCVIHSTGCSSIVVRDLRNAYLSGRHSLAKAANRTTYAPGVSIAYRYDIDVYLDAQGTASASRVKHFEFHSARLGVKAWTAPVQVVSSSLFPDRTLTYGVSVPANVSRRWQYAHPHVVYNVSASASTACAYTFDVLVQARLDADLSRSGVIGRASHVQLILRSSIDGSATVLEEHAHVLHIEEGGVGDWVRASVGVVLPKGVESSSRVCIDFEVRPVLLAAITIGLRDPGFFVNSVEVVDLQPGATYETVVTFTCIDDEAEEPVQELEYEMARVRLAMPDARPTGPPIEYLGAEGVHVLGIDVDTPRHACLLRGPDDIRIGDARVLVGTRAGAFVDQAAGHAVVASASSPLLAPGFDSVADAALRFDGGGVVCTVGGDDVVPALRAVNTGAFDISCYVRGATDDLLVLHAPRPAETVLDGAVTYSAVDVVSGGAPTLVQDGVVTSSHSLPLSMAAPGSASGTVTPAAFRFAGASNTLPFVQYEAPVCVTAPNRRTFNAGFFALVLSSDLARATRSRSLCSIGLPSASIHVHVEPISGSISVFLFTLIGGGTAETLYSNGSRLTPDVWEHVFVSVDLDSSATTVYIGGVAVSPTQTRIRATTSIFSMSAEGTSIVWGNIDPRTPVSSQAVPVTVLVALPCIASTPEYRFLHARGILPETLMTVWSFPIATGGTFGLHFRRSFEDARMTASFIATLGSASSVQVDITQAAAPAAATGWDAWSYVALRRSDTGVIELAVTTAVGAAAGGHSTVISTATSSLSLALISASELTLGALTLPLSGAYASAMIGVIDEFAILPRARTTAATPGRRRNAWRSTRSMREDAPTRGASNLGVLPRADASGVVDETGGFWLYGGEGDAGTCADVWLLVPSGDDEGVIDAYNMLPSSAAAGNVDPDPSSETPGSRQLHAMCVDGSSAADDSLGGQTFFVYGGLAQQRVGPFYIYGTFAASAGADAGTGAVVPLPTQPGAMTGYIYPLYTSRVALLLDFSPEETVSIAVSPASSSPGSSFELWTTTTSASWLNGPRVAAPPAGAYHLFDEDVHIDTAAYALTGATTRATTTSEVRGDLWSYQVSTGTWQRLYDASESSAAAPSPRWGAHLWHHHNCLYVFGGAGIADSSLYEFDLELMRWTVRSSSSAAGPVFAYPAATSGSFTFDRAVTPGSSIGPAIFYATAAVTDDVTSLRPALYSAGATFVNQLEGAFLETNQHFAVAVRGSATFEADGYSAPKISVDTEARSTVVAEPVTPELRVDMVPSVAPGAMLVLTNADASASACILSAVQLSVERADADAVTIAASSSTGVDTVVASHDSPSSSSSLLLLLAGALPRGTLDDFVLVPGVTRLHIDLSGSSNRGKVLSVFASLDPSVDLAASSASPYVVTSPAPPGFTGAYIDIVGAPQGEPRLLVQSRDSGAPFFGVVVYTPAMLREAVTVPTTSASSSPTPTTTTTTTAASTYKLHILAPPAPLQALLPAAVSARSVEMVVTDSDANTATIALAFQDNNDARRGKIAHIDADFSLPTLSAAPSVSTFSSAGPTLNIALCDRVREGAWMTRSGGAIVAHASDSGDLLNSGLFARSVAALDSSTGLGPELVASSVAGIGALTMLPLDWHTSASSSRGVWLTAFTYLGAGRLLPQRVDTATDPTTSPIVQTLLGGTLQYTPVPLVFISGLSGGVSSLRSSVFPAGGDLAGDAVVVFVGGAQSDLRYFDVACRDADPSTDEAGARLSRRTTTFSLLEDVTLIATGVFDARVLTATTVRDSRSAFVVVYTPQTRDVIFTRGFEWNDGSYSALSSAVVVVDSLASVQLDDVEIVVQTDDAPEAQPDVDPRVVQVSYVCWSAEASAHSIRIVTFPLGAILTDTAAGPSVSARASFLSVSPDNSLPVLDAVLRTYSDPVTSTQRLIGVVTHVGDAKETGLIVRRTIDVPAAAYSTADAVSGFLTLSRETRLARMTEGDYSLIDDFVAELDARLKVLDPSFSAEYSTATTKISLRNKHSAFRLILSQQQADTTVTRTNASSEALESNIGLAYILGFRDYGVDVASTEGAADHFVQAPSRIDMRGRSYVYIYIGDGSEWFSSESARGRQAALGRLQLAVQKGETMYWTTGASFSIEAKVQVQALKHLHVRFGRYPLIAEMSGEHRATMLYDTAGVEHSFTLRVTCLNDKTGSGHADFQTRVVPRLPSVAPFPTGGGIDMFGRNDEFGVGVEERRIGGERSSFSSRSSGSDMSSGGYESG